ncbi:MAG: hypothetical protein GTN70_06885 [Deltaproteobacteria bacterium]|nr:hypothetical protein [Deltaproteobacteria bacterium]NIS77420.1 hypothetical protein [Deltaproteobacteria bacterium]
MKFKFDMPLPDQDRVRAQFIPRFVAKGIDLVIALCLWHIPGASGVIAAIFYLLIADGFIGGRSPGKMLSGLKVVRLDGEHFDYLSSILRNIPVALPFFLFIIPSIGHFLAYTVGAGVLIVEASFCLYNEDGMRIGDTVASTAVIFQPEKESEPVSESAEEEL